MEKLCGVCLILTSLHEKRTFIWDTALKLRSYVHNIPSLVACYCLVSYLRTHLTWCIHTCFDKARNYCFRLIYILLIASEGYPSRCCSKQVFFFQFTLSRTLPKLFARRTSLKRAFRSRGVRPRSATIL